MELRVRELKREDIEECVDLFINTFTKEPWFDVYESREPLVRYFENHMANNYFLGFIGLLQKEIVAVSIGMKKPWIEGMEYYIDEFCVSYDYQGKGIGSLFLKEIEEQLSNYKVEGILLNTEEGYPSYDFYKKNGFKKKGDLVILVK